MDGVFSFAAVERGYRDCRRRKRGTANAQRYERRLLDRLVDTAEALQSRRYAPARSLCFVARQPKAREIHAADFSDRVVHHVLVPRLEALFEPVFIHDLYFREAFAPALPLIQIGNRVALFGPELERALVVAPWLGQWRAGRDEQRPGFPPAALGRYRTSRAWGARCVLKLCPMSMSPRKGIYPAA